MAVAEIEREMNRRAHKEMDREGIVHDVVVWRLAQQYITLRATDKRDAANYVAKALACLMEEHNG